MSENNNHNQDTLLEFPCEFNLKAIGLAGESFDLFMLEIVQKHVTDLPEDSLTSRESSNGKYHSVTITFTAISKLQLDTIYIELSDHERVIMAL